MRLNTQKDKLAWSSIKKMIQEINIRKLTYIPLLSALGFFLIGGFVGVVIFDGNPNEVYMGCIGIIGTLIASFSGVFQIIKKEAPAIGNSVYKGLYAVFSGVIWACFCLFIIFWIVYGILSGN